MIELVQVFFHQKVSSIVTVPMSVPLFRDEFQEISDIFSSSYAKVLVMLSTKFPLKGGFAEFLSSTLYHRINNEQRNLACLVRGSFLIARLENCKSRCPAVQGWWNVVVDQGVVESSVVTVIDHHFYRLVGLPTITLVGLSLSKRFPTICKLVA